MKHHRVHISYICDAFGCEPRTAERWCQLGNFKTACKATDTSRWTVEKSEIDQLLKARLEAAKAEAAKSGAKERQKV
jgi:predicted site-specific integrase-resolvase